MFGDPKKELKRLDAELLALAEEEPEEAWEEAEGDELSPGENPAVDFGRMAYADEYLDDDQVLVKGKKSRKAAKKAARKEETKKGKKTRKRKLLTVPQLMFAILEVILIILVVRWWLQWNS